MVYTGTAEWLLIFMMLLKILYVTYDSGYKLWVWLSKLVATRGVNYIYYGTSTGSSRANCFKNLMISIHKRRKIGRDKDTRMTRAGYLVIPEYQEAHSCRTSVSDPRSSDRPLETNLCSSRGKGVGMLDFLDEENQCNTHDYMSSQAKTGGTAACIIFWEWIFPTTP